MKNFIYKILQAIKSMLWDSTENKIGSKKVAGFLCLIVLIHLFYIDTLSLPVAQGGHHPSDSVLWYLLGLISFFWGASSWDKNNFMKSQSGKS